MELNNHAGQDDAFFKGQPTFFLYWLFFSNGIMNKGLWGMKLKVAGGSTTWIFTHQNQSGYIHLVLNVTTLRPKLHLVNVASFWGTRQLSGGKLITWTTSIMEHLVLIGICSYPG